MGCSSPVVSPPPPLSGQLQLLVIISCLPTSCHQGLYGPLLLWRNATVSLPTPTPPVWLLNLFFISCELNVLTLKYLRDVWFYEKTLSHCYHPSRLQPQVCGI